MQSSLDRQQAIFEILSDRGKKTISNLMAESGVNKSKILKLILMDESTIELTSEIDRIFYKKIKFLYCRSPPIRFFTN